VSQSVSQQQQVHTADSEQCRFNSESSILVEEENLFIRPNDQTNNPQSLQFSPMYIV
jgi:hypothetical protein